MVYNLEHILLLCASCIIVKGSYVFFTTFYVKFIYTFFPCIYVFLTSLIYHTWVPSLLYNLGISAATKTSQNPLTITHMTLPYIPNFDIFIVLVTSFWIELIVKINQIVVLYYFYYMDIYIPLFTLKFAYNFLS